MSPTEDDLRAALHRDDGERPDVERAVAAGRARRSARRTRIASVAAAVVVVAAAASVGGVLLARDDDGARRTADRPDPAAPARTTTEAPSATADPIPAPGTSFGRGGIAVPPTDGVLCPAAPSARQLPGRASGTGSLFPTTPVAIVVCSYGDRPGAAAGRTVLTEASAADLVASLDAASATPTGRTCSDPGRTYAFVGVSGTGVPLRTVTTTVSRSACDTRTTNGAVVRYGWQPPASLRRVLAALPDG